MPKKQKQVKSYPDLQSFLKAGENTVTRERLLFHRFCFDAYLAVSRRMYALAVLSIEVDYLAAGAKHNSNGLFIGSYSICHRIRL